MNQLQVFEQDGELYTDSRNVALMVDKQHSHLLRDIENYIDKSKSGLISFFIEDSYTDSMNRVRKNYLLTKKGCDMVANKMTGEKGVQFTEAYVEQFHKMENHIKSKQYQVPTTTEGVLELFFTMHKEDRAAIKEIKNDMRNIREIVSLETKDWRNDTNKVLNRIAQTLGGGMYHKDVRSEAYQLLETKGRCKLDQRVINRKRKAAANGLSKSAVQKISKLDVIGEEPRLIEIYISVIQKMAIKYGIDFNELEVS